MKLIKIAAPLALALAFSLTAVGCKSTKGVVTPLDQYGRPIKNQNDPNLGPGGVLESGTNSASIGDISKTGLPAGPGHPGWDQNRSTFAADTVHFEYDSTAIRADDKSKISAVADYLKSNAANAVLVEGHCDERGTDEYNRALGERRALAIREELARLGVAADRVDTISFGKDRPVDTGRSEASHRKNRRGEFVLLTEPAK